MANLEQYIRYAAAQRGIDPDIAVKVARSEGGLNDPIRQSGVLKNGVREPSYGPFQLLVGGEGTGFPSGLGNAALAAGIDPRKPEHAQRAIDFALDTAAKKGWGQWYGAKAVGLDNFAGIGGRSASPGGPAPTLGLTAAPDGPKGQESYAPVMGSMVASAQPSAASPDIPAAVQAAASPSSQRSKAADIFGMLAMADNRPQFSPVQIMGPSAGQSQGLLSLLSSLRGRV